MCELQILEGVKWVIQNMMLRASERKDSTEIGVNERVGPSRGNDTGVTRSADSQAPFVADSTVR